ncbi:unnamed protein product, partial [Sphacelaria rigidula]
CASTRSDFATTPFIRSFKAGRRADKTICTRVAGWKAQLPWCERTAEERIDHPQGTSALRRTR